MHNRGLSLFVQATISVLSLSPIVIAQDKAPVAPVKPAPAVDPVTKPGDPPAQKPETPLDAESLAVEAVFARAREAIGGAAAEKTLSHAELTWRVTDPKQSSSVLRVVLDLPDRAIALFQASTGARMGTERIRLGNGGPGVAQPSPTPEIEVSKVIPGRTFLVEIHGFVPGFGWMYPNRNYEKGANWKVSYFRNDDVKSCRAKFGVYTGWFRIEDLPSARLGAPLELNNQRCLHVLVGKNTRGIKEIVFNEQTALPVALDFTEEDNKQYRFTYEDWKEHDGVLLCGKITRSSGDAKITLDSPTLVPNTKFEELVAWFQRQCYNEVVPDIVETHRLM